MTATASRAALATRWALFDLDGCLIDSSVAIPHCLNVALVAGGREERPVGELLACIGPPLATSLRRLLARPGSAAPDVEVMAALQAYRVAFDEVAADLTTVVDGMPELLSDLPHRRAVVTSKPLPAAVPMVAAMDLDRHVEAVFAPGEGVEDEPKARTLGRALDRLGITDPASATMVGDRHHDVEAGRRHGCATVGVTWGSGDRAELTAAGADAVVDHPAQLRDVLVG